MLLKMPSYYRDFRCRSGGCSDSCCIGWEIDVDKDTLRSYSLLKTPFGERLQKNISTDGTAHFIMRTDGRCPFLDENGLCEIYTELGEKHLCQICSDHPRYYAWYSGVKEGGIGLCCEAAAELILTQKENFSYYDTEIPDEDCEGYDEGFFEYLSALRDRMTIHLESRELPLRTRLADVLLYAKNAQELYDDFDFSVHAVGISRQRINEDISAEIPAFFSGLESMEDKNIFLSVYENFGELVPLSEQLSQRLPQTERYLENAAVYFLQRHFLKGVFEEEFYSRAAFAVLSTAVLKLLFAEAYRRNGSLTLKDAVRAAVYFSKEIEYSEENMNKIFDSFYDNEHFSPSFIINLLDIV